jgi:hypothetical protein
MLSTCTGNVSGNWPPGLTMPYITSAIACPASLTEYHACSKLSIHIIDTAEPWVMYAMSSNIYGCTNTHSLNAHNHLDAQATEDLACQSLRFPIQVKGRRGTRQRQPEWLTIPLRQLLDRGLFSGNHPNAKRKIS